MNRGDNACVLFRTKFEGLPENTNLDSMHRANGNPRDGNAGKDMADDLEDTHRKGALQNLFGGFAEVGESYQRRHKQQTICSYESKLNECKGDRVAELGEDRFACVRRQGRGGIPQGTH